jgi:hypothetical protein
MTVKAIGADIQNTVGKPFNLDGGKKIAALGDRERLDPVKITLRFTGPEIRWIIMRFL